MKNIKVLAKNFLSNKKQLLMIGIAITISVFTCLTNSNYNMNPFIGICLIYLAKNSFAGLALNIIAILIVGFTKSLYYGLELAIISFFWLSLFALPKSKNRRYLDILPVFIFYSVISPLFLISNFNRANIIRALFSFIFTLSSFYSMTRDEKEGEHIKIINQLTLSFLPSLFISYNNLLLCAVFISFFYSFYKTENVVERIAFITCSFIISYFYLLIPTDILIKTYPVLFITAMIKHPLFASLLFTLATSIISIAYKPTSFYKYEEFYLPLIALCVALLFTPLTKRETCFPLDKRQEKINNIHEYLSLVLDSSFDPNLDKKSLRENLKIKMCHKCSHEADCVHLNRLVDNLPNKLYKPYKDEVLKNCPNGGKLVYRYRVLKEMVKYEQRDLAIKKEQYNALKSIVNPIKSLCYSEEENINSNTINNTLNKNIVLSLEDNSIITLEKLSENETKLVNNLLHCKINNEPLFNLLEHTFIYNYEKINEKALVIDNFKKNFTAKSGDIFDHYKGQNFEELVLIDAMGHNDTSGRYAKVAQRILTLSRTNDISIENRLKELNTILSYQSGGENFIALDLIYIQSNTVKLFKFGSTTTYLIKANEIIEYNNFNPPLGIVSELNYTPIELEIKRGDKIILYSDGIALDKETILKMQNNKKVKAADLYEFSNKNEDDITISVIEFNKDYQYSKVKQ